MIYVLLVVGVAFIVVSIILFVKPSLVERLHDLTSSADFPEGYSAERIEFKQRYGVPLEFFCMGLLLIVLYILFN